MSDSSAPSSTPPEPSHGPAGTTTPPLVAASGPTGEGGADAQAAGDSTGLPPHLAAGLASILSIVGGVVFLILERKNQFVRFYAMQAVILGAVVILFFIALEVIAWILHHIPFLGALFVFLLDLGGMAVGLAYLALIVMTAMKALAGQEWEIPYLGKIAREQLASRAPTAP